MDELPTEVYEDVAAESWRVSCVSASKMRFGAMCRDLTGALHVCGGAAVARLEWTFRARVCVLACSLGPQLVCSHCTHHMGCTSTEILTEKASNGPKQVVGHARQMSREPDVVLATRSLNERNYSLNKLPAYGTPTQLYMRKRQDTTTIPSPDGAGWGLGCVAKCFTFKTLPWKNEHEKK
jgi:hypothetical protein